MQGGTLTVKYALDVDIKDVVPALLFWKVMIRTTPSYSRIVDKNMKAGLALFEFRDECIATSF